MDGSTRRRFLGAFAALAMSLAASQAFAGPGAERFEVRGRAQRTIDPVDGKAIYILTLDACGGQFDWELANHLVERSIPASIFVTKVFIDGNPKAVDFLKSHPEIFDIQNHGARHRAAIEASGEIWKVAMVATPQGLRDEVQGGARAIELAFGKKTTLFRGATAVYDGNGKKDVEGLGYEVAGYEVSLDGGGVLPAWMIMGKALEAKPGAVLLGHINRPKTHNGAHIAAALDALSARGAKFESWTQASIAGQVTQWRQAKP